MRPPNEKEKGELGHYGNKAIGGGDRRRGVV